ncbi:MAG: hypothetical protein WCO52_00150 [bacterium]
MEENTWRNFSCPLRKYLILDIGGEQVLVADRSTGGTAPVAILRKYMDQMGLDKVTVCGCGSVHRIDATKTVVMQGTRSEFGPADHETVVRLAAKSLANEGFGSYALKVSGTVGDIQKVRRIELCL